MNLMRTYFEPVSSDDQINILNRALVPKYEIINIYNNEHEDKLTNETLHIIMGLFLSDPDYGGDFIYGLKYKKCPSNVTDLITERIKFTYEKKWSQLNLCGLNIKNKKKGDINIPDIPNNIEVINYSHNNIKTMDGLKFDKVKKYIIKGNESLLLDKYYMENDEYIIN